MSQTLEALVVELRADVKGLQTSLQTATADVQRFSNSASTSVNRFRSAVSSASTAVFSLGAAWAAFKVGKDIIDAGVQIQALGYRMNAATGNAKVAAEALAFVRAESERLGLSFVDSANSFASFAASALRSGMTFQQTKDVFTGIAEAVTALHLPAAQAQSAFLAIEQMASKGTVQMQELKLQLASAIPGALEIMAKASGKSVQEFNKLIGQGEVLATDALPKLAQAFRDQFGAQAEEAAQGAQAAFNRLGNSLFELEAKMANSGFLDAVTNGVKDLTAALNDPATVDGLTKFAQALAVIANMALKVASSMGSALYKVGEFETKALAVVGLGAGTASAQDAAETISLRARVIAAYTAKQKGASASSAPTGSYTLGTPGVALPSEAAQRAAQARQNLRDQLSRQNAGLIDESDPNKADSAKAVADLNKRYAEEQDLIEKALKKKAITEQQAREDSLKLEIDYQARMAEIRKQYRDDFLSDAQSAAEGFLGIQLNMQDRSISEQASSFRDSISEAAKHNRTFFELEKAASIARALLAARESVVSAYNFGSRLGGPPLGAVFAGVAAAAQAVNIAAIASTSFNGGGSGVSDGGGASAGSSAADTSTSGTGAAAAPSKSVYITLNGDDNALFSKNTIRKLIENINDAVSDGTQLKVAVSG